MQRIILTDLQHDVDRLFIVKKALKLANVIVTQLSVNLNLTHKFCFGFVLRETGFFYELARPRNIAIDIGEFVTGCETALA